MAELVNGKSGRQFSGDDRPCAAEDWATKDMERGGLRGIMKGTRLVDYGDSDLVNAYTFSTMPVCICF